MTRTMRIAMVWAAVIVTAALGYLYVRSLDGSHTPAVQIGGNFALRSARQGGVLSSDSLKGKPYAVFFGFTNCPEVCPTTLNDMTTTLTALGDAAKDFRVFFVTVDPERDTAQFLNDYLSNFDPRIEALVPTPAQLPDVAKSFRVIYEKVPTSDGSYTMNHTASVFLYDSAGEFAGTLAYGEAPDMRLRKLKKLLER